ncbi:ABC transporter ATP-binding protein [Nonomuraea turcica]|uniref:ABC transporter ATP-binding protein n=1 Tax=Nonomuraea sp. G32 TaxID=3067274 RepID=UPI00273B0529|nr:ABC transporter ATP-binding protein [Nonomuraea sp. G32]MDP4501321.1 ABC transporter ATP-binding protein [Nonomuraea sp. G32]
MTAGSPGAPRLLEIDGLVTHFPLPRGTFGARRKVVRAVDGVSFAVEAGEMVALVGESGSGKTTTAQSVLRMVEPTAGTIRFRGQDITALGRRPLKPVRRRMQVVYQDPYESLDPRFRIGRSVAEPLAVHGVGTRAERRDVVLRALERAGLTPAEMFADRYPHELSGGQRQRAAIAAALVLGPDLLIADEPVSMLDVSVRAGVLAVFDELRRSGLGILMITHDLSTAVHHADRIAVMYLGRIVEEGPAAEVVRNPAHPYTRALVAAVPRVGHAGRPIEIRPGEPPDPAAVPDGCRFHPRCPIAVEECARVDPALLPAAGPASHRAACPITRQEDT